MKKSGLIIVCFSIVFLLFHCATMVSNNLVSSSLYYEQGNYGEALSWAKKALAQKSDMDNIRLYQTYIYSAFRLKRYDDIAELIKTPGINDSLLYSDQNLVYYSAIACYYTKDYSESLRLFRMISNYGNVFNEWLPNVLYRNGRYDELLETYHQTLSSSPDKISTEWITKVALAYSENEEYEKALTLLLTIPEEERDESVKQLMITYAIKTGRLYDELEKVIPDLNTMVTFSVGNRLKFKGRKGYEFYWISKLYSEGKLLQASEKLVNDTSLINVCKQYNFYPFLRIKVVSASDLKKYSLDYLKQMYEEYQQAYDLLAEHFSIWILSSLKRKISSIELVIPEKVFQEEVDKLFASRESGHTFTDEELNRAFKLIYKGKEMLKNYQWDYIEKVNDIIELLDDQNLTGTNADRLQYEKVAVKYYDEVRKSYSGSTLSLIDLFKKNLEYCKTDSICMKNLYMVARILRENGFAHPAFKYYEEVMKRFPGSYLADDSRFLRGALDGDDEEKLKYLQPILDDENSDMRDYTIAIISDYFYYPLDVKMVEKLFKLWKELNPDNDYVWKKIIFYSVTRNYQKIDELLKNVEKNSYYYQSILKVISGQAFSLNDRRNSIKYIDLLVEADSSRKIKAAAEFYRNMDLETYLDLITNIPDDWLSTLPDDPHELLNTIDIIQKERKNDYKIKALGKGVLMPDNPVIDQFTYLLAKELKNELYNSAAFYLFSKIKSDSKYYTSAQMELAKLYKSVYLFNEYMNKLDEAYKYGDEGIKFQVLSEKIKISKNLGEKIIMSDEMLSYLDTISDDENKEYLKERIINNKMELIFFGLKDFSRTINEGERYLKNGIRLKDKVKKGIALSYLYQSDIDGCIAFVRNYMADEGNETAIFQIADYITFILDKPDAGLELVKLVNSSQQNIQNARERRIQLYSEEG